MSPYDSLGPHTRWLRMAAKAMSREGYQGWSNTCEQAADAIDGVLRGYESAKAAVTDETVETACKAASLHSDDAIFPDDYGDGEADDVRNYMRAALEAVAPMLASARVPEGWQLVPVEPTVEMMRAGDDTGFHTYTGTWSITPDACWQAMLAAAPKPETKE